MTAAPVRRDQITLDYEELVFYDCDSYQLVVEPQVETVDFTCRAGPGNHITVEMPVDKFRDWLECLQWLVKANPQVFER